MLAGNRPPKVKLYMFPGSNSVYTAQLMLKHKGIEHDTVTLLPGPHAFVMLALGFPTMGVPALKIDGRRVQGTRAISRALDELVAERPLFPADPARRKTVQDVERWGEDLQNATRRIFYAVARRDRAAYLSVMTPGRSLPARAALRFSGGVVIRLATGAHRASDEACQDDLAHLPERLDQIDAWIAEGVLGGEELNAADFQIAANVSALMLSDDLKPFMEGRPAAALGQRLAANYIGHLPAILPTEWLLPLRDARRGSVGLTTAGTGPAVVRAS